MAKTATKEQQTVTLLNKQVANWAVMYVKLHQFHWYLKGPSFFVLHVKFEELYKEADLYLDQIAERILQLKGKPLSTTKEFQANSSIKEVSPERNAGQMVEELVQDFKTITEESKELIEAAEESGDHGTADMITEICMNLEKHIWMLESYMND
ncbi:Dps family protein [Paenibacillus lutrae]|uniref:DNA starvation/stationary phase protection protein n=1 Tax=Paenibacillus lutrae TaxID=2078573 RepID=A0A7X3FM91_9BACL|nr:Dps family protein [Paenibacillus lutrae]MVP02338.1 DNA starvation/stationary phase protection protein [Paenibacillus lutrae]